MHGTFQMKHSEFCMFNKDPAGLRELNALATSLKEYDAQLRLQILNLLSQPRLGQVEAGSGTREVQFIG